MEELRPDQIAQGDDAPIEEQYELGKKSAEIATHRGVAEFYAKQFDDYAASIEKATGRKPFSAAERASILDDWTGGFGPESAEQQASRIARGEKLLEKVDFDKRIQEIRAANPKADFQTRTRAELYDEATTKIEQHAASLDRDLDSTKAGFLGTLARFGGQFVGFMTDPINAVTMLATPTKAGESALKYIAKSAGLNAGIQVGVSADTANLRPKMEDKGTFVAAGALFAGAAGGLGAAAEIGAQGALKWVSNAIKNKAGVKTISEALDAVAEPTVETAIAKADLDVLDQLNIHSSKAANELNIDKLSRIADQLDAGHAVLPEQLPSAISPRSAEFDWAVAKESGQSLTPTPSGLGMLKSDLYSSADEAYDFIAREGYPDGLHVARLDMEPDAQGRPQYSYGVVRDAPDLEFIQPTNSLAKAETQLKINRSNTLFKDEFGFSPERLEIVETADGYALVDGAVLTPQIREELLNTPRQFLDAPLESAQAFKERALLRDVDQHLAAPGTLPRQSLEGAALDEAMFAKSESLQNEIASAPQRLKLRENNSLADLDGFAPSEDLVKHFDSTKKLSENLADISKQVKELLGCAIGGSSK